LRFLFIPGRLDEDASGESHVLLEDRKMENP
jgi:hypothetical protein